MGVLSLARAADGSRGLLAWTADRESTIKSLGCVVNHETRSKINGQGVWVFGTRWAVSRVRTRLRKSFDRVEKLHHHAFSTFCSLETHAENSSSRPCRTRLPKCSHMHASTVMLSQTHSLVPSWFCRSSSSLEIAVAAPSCSQPANLLDVGV